MWLYVQTLYPLLMVGLCVVVGFVAVLALLNRQTPKQARIDSGSVQGKKRRGTFN
jgi:hypothetical protein